MAGTCDFIVVGSGHNGLTAAAYLATTDSPLADALALDGISRLCRWLPRAVADGSDLAARREVMLGAFAGGVAIGKGLGPAHAIAISCGDQGLHHGMLSALGLVASMDTMALHVPDRMRHIAEAMGLAPGAGVAGGGIRDLPVAFGLPEGLAALGYVLRDGMALALAASHFNLTSPYQPDAAEFTAMLERIDITTETSKKGTAQ